MEFVEKKRSNRGRIAKFISVMGSTSKAEISRSLQLSMPTTLQCIKELTSMGIVREHGEYESTGGRRAKALSIVSDAGYAVGVDITNNHITMVMADGKKEIAVSERLRIPFENSREYYLVLEKQIVSFIEKTNKDKNKVLGIGFSLPGIVNQEQKLLSRSHTLKVQNISFKGIGEALGYPYTVVNDANSAAYAEMGNQMQNAVYLSLSNTVGGAICMANRLYEGENFKSAEFGHMIIVHEGKTCYCGKKGCIDAYCRAGILQEAFGESLEEFFRRVRKQDAEALAVWEEYLEYLAVAVANLRMAFDCEIVLGGYVGGYIQEFLPELSVKIQKYNNFDVDTAYVHAGKYKLEASAYGAALPFLDEFLESI